MVCGRDAYEDLPHRAKQREEDRKRRDTEAANKIAQFFALTFGTGAVLGSCDENRPTTIRLKQTDPGCLLVHHRGQEIFVDSSSDPNAELKFRAWCEKEMPHAKVFPRNPPMQTH